MSLKITTLIENIEDDFRKLFFEHGFSVLIELDEKKILFDTGQSGAFVNNAKCMGLDLAEVDAVILSHGHYDHTGGVPELLKVLKRKIPFYIGKEFFAPKYKLLEDVTRISENLVLFKNFARVTDYCRIPLYRRSWHGTFTAGISGGLCT